MEKWKEDTSDPDFLIMIIMIRKSESVMADLRNRGEVSKIVGATDTFVSFF